MSGLGTKSKDNKNKFLIINYKLLKNDEPASLVFDTILSRTFVRMYDYKKKNGLKNI